jgi:hypothetical protein
MLLHGDGTNAAQNNTFLDGSTNNFTVTRNGNTTQGSFNPFVSTYPYSVATNGGSGYFDGTGDYLTVPDSTAFTFGTNDFTIECWIYSSLAGNYGIMSNCDSATSTSSMSFYLAAFGTGVQANAAYGSTLVGAGAPALTPNAWNHIAFVRDGTVTRAYTNGVQGSGTGAIGTNALNDSVNPMTVGRLGNYAALYFNGYISNLRIVNGTCLYPSGTTFTPPTAPLTAVTNTALLLGMSNAAIFDNAILNNLETVASAQISTSVFKYGTGSMKFGGTATDYMPTRKTSALTLGSSDFTIECWVNFASATANGYFAGDYDGTANFNFYMYVASGTLQNTWRQSGGGNIACISSAGAIVINTWYHIAFVRDGNTNRQYINGVQNGTVSVTGLTADTNANPLAIGAVGSTPLAPYFNGYIDDFRFTKGICRYPSGTTFTPPTAAFPNQGLAPFAGGTLQTLVVAGGGGGGAPQSVFAAGGGAGGYLTTTGLGVPSGVSLPVIVGSGGAVGSASAGANGGNSSFWSSLAYGGGGGGLSVTVAGPPYTSNADGSAGLSGGSGGGGGSQYYPYGIGYAAGAGIAGQGYAGAVGGVTSTGPNGSGGGGAGGSPVASTGTGGAGVVSSITGSSVTYAKGGIGDLGPNTTPAVNTGSGGGGYSTATAGASGIVVIRYADSYPAATATTGSPTITVAGGYRVYKFTATGSITF